ncbi:MAG TPA: tetratricopeptide repeat protein [Candidatus Obscuribacterales bacterium]
MPLSLRAITISNGAVQLRLPSDWRESDRSDKGVRYDAPGKKQWLKINIFGPEKVASAKELEDWVRKKTLTARIVQKMANDAFLFDAGTAPDEINAVAMTRTYLIVAAFLPKEKLGMAYHFLYYEDVKLANDSEAVEARKAIDREIRTCRVEPIALSRAASMKSGSPAAAALAPVAMVIGLGVLGYGGYWLYDSLTRVPTWEESTARAQQAIAAGNMADAEKTMREALTRAEDKNDQPLIAQGSLMLGDIYSKQGKFDKALPMYEVALQIQEDSLGRSNKTVTATAMKFADTLRKVGDGNRADQVLKLYQSTMASAAKTQNAKKSKQARK